MPVNLLIFTNTSYRRDFRKYLMGAAERSGGNALHLSAREKLILSWAGAERAEYSANGNSNELRQLISDRLSLARSWGLPDWGDEIGRARGRVRVEPAQRSARCPLDI